MVRVNRGITRLKKFKPGEKKGRYEILHRRKAVAAAKGKSTKQMNLATGLEFRPMGSLIEGQVLKKGVIGMGTRAVAPNEIMEKLHRMDPRYLQGMYEKNKLLFEVFYSYEGVDFHDGVYEVGEEKLDDVRLLIQEYERIYGAL